MTKYALEVLDDDDDDGTMPENVDALREAVIGHRIVKAEKAYTETWWGASRHALVHIITGVGTTDGYATWHIYADMGDVLELSVGWSCGNPFYYGYGFDISVKELTVE
jgi:hypothetical protein